MSDVYIHNKTKDSHISLTEEELNCLFPPDKDRFRLSQQYQELVLSTLNAVFQTGVTKVTLDCVIRTTSKVFTVYYEPRTKELEELAVPEMELRDYICELYYYYNWTANGGARIEFTPTSATIDIWEDVVIQKSTLSYP